MKWLGIIVSHIFNKQGRKKHLNLVNEDRLWDIEERETRGVKKKKEHPK